ncbi:MAG: SCO family protein [Alphaproteobacteria bacterium]|nr:SCO family protein [Alphaproteobacteria bacterium]
MLAVLVILSVAALAGRHYLGWFADGVEPPKPKIAVGGPFALTDQDGKPRADADFRGKYMLVYFGFTYCPDVCPTALTTMGQALDILGPKGADVVPVFITVDPERDTPEQLKEYVRHFHPRMVGLTGSKDQIAAVAKAYRVYFAKVRQQGAPEDEYTMDHTSIAYLMGPDGTFVVHFSHGTEPAAMAARIRQALN